MDIIPIDKLPKIPKLKIAVIGHVEWVTFLYVDKLPSPGRISHSEKVIDTPAGGGVVSAVRIANLLGTNVDFFTSLGNDSLGKKTYKILQGLGLNSHVAWRNKPTRRGVSFVSSEGERGITVIGERLQPKAKDKLPWEELKTFDGVFLTAADSEAIKKGRQAKVLVATPRAGIKTLIESKVILDALIGSGLDPDEKINETELLKNSRIRVCTEGEKGGLTFPGGRYNPAQLMSPLVDSYGCGDSFAAGFTTAIAANWSLNQAVSLAAHCGADAGTYFGPYRNHLTAINQIGIL